MSEAIRRLSVAHVRRPTSSVEKNPIPDPPAVGNRPGSPPRAIVSLPGAPGEERHLWL